MPRGANQRHIAAFNVLEQKILLRFVEAVNFVYE
jgi:hypothetical protein